MRSYPLPHIHTYTRLAAQIYRQTDRTNPKLTSQAHHVILDGNTRCNETYRESSPRNRDGKLRGIHPLSRVVVFQAVELSNQNDHSQAIQEADERTRRDLVKKGYLK